MPPSPEIYDQQSLTNLLRNGGMEQWGTSAPAYWTLAGAGGSAAQDASVLHVGTAACKLTRAGSDVTLTQDVVGQTASLASVQGQTVTLNVAVRIAVAPTTGPRVQIGIDDGVSISWSGYRAAAGSFSILKVTRTLKLAATKLAVILKLSGADGEAWVDAAILVRGNACPEFQPNPADSRDPQIADPLTPSTPTGLTLTSKALSIVVTWDAAPETDVAYWELHRANDSGFTTGLITHRLYAIGYPDATRNTTTYYYRVRAVRNSGAVSAWTAAVSGAAGQIQTPHVEDDAVTVDGVYENDEETSPYTEEGEVEIGSITVSTDGGSVVVIGSAMQVSGSSFGTVLRVRKDSTSVAVLVTGRTGTFTTGTIVGRDASPAPTQMYVLTATGGNEAEHVCSTRRLYSLNRKK
jgi:hypothetical protein